MTAAQFGNMLGGIAMLFVALAFSSAAVAFMGALRSELHGRRDFILCYSAATGVAISAAATIGFAGFGLACILGVVA